MVAFSVLTVMLGVIGLLHSHSTNAGIVKDPKLLSKLTKIQELSEASGLSSASWVKRTTDADKRQEDAEICLDEGCLDTALDLLQSVNFTVDPCEDFYQFACGKWLANTPIPSESSTWSFFDPLVFEVNRIIQEILNEEVNMNDPKPVNQVKSFYNECVNIDKLDYIGLTPVITILQEFGGWPLLNPSEWSESNFDWIKSLGNLRRRLLGQYNIPLLNIFIESDLKNTTRYLVFLDQPPLFGLRRNILIDAGNYETLISSYRTYIVELALELGSTETQGSLEAAAQALIDFEIQLANISLSYEEQYDMENRYNPYLLNEFQQVTDAADPTFSIDWKKLLDVVFSSSGIEIKPDEELNIAGLSYVTNLIPILKATPPKVIADYIGLNIVSKFASETTQGLRNIKTKFDLSLTGAQEGSPRETVCATLANRYFGMAIGAKYIEAAFDREAKDLVEGLVENVRASFKELLEEADWMEESTKIQAQAKADTIKSFMAYPDWLENATALEAFYSGLELSSGDEESHFQNILNIELWSSDGKLAHLRDPTPKDEWIAEPGVVNAFYNPPRNSITFPAGILQPPYFGKLRPASQNYGGIGTVIGHEMTHGFDNMGSQFDKDGNAINWWDDLTKQRYEEKSQCVVDQYSGYYVSQVDMYINGEITLGENIADMGGLREGFRAYRQYIDTLGKEEGRLPGMEQITPNQLFFLGYSHAWCSKRTDESMLAFLLGNPHSPTEFRVIGPLTNANEFAETFACPVGSGMNPPLADKCAVW